jgi:8-oxo-dGTP pyrophosphatase MutT (NUDIX family)
VDVEVLLVTSSAGRWIIPKGDIDEGMPSYQAAEKEAFEEGGVRGQMGDRPLGTFQTCKQRDGASIRADVDVFPLKVVEELDRWPEMGVRQRRWRFESLNWPQLSGPSRTEAPRRHLPR